MSAQCEAILLLNPVKNFLSAEVYCCVIREIGLKPDADVLEYLNQNYSGFMDAVELVSLGEILLLNKMIWNKSRRMQASFPTLTKAKEELKDHNLYYYDMSEEKYKWVRL